MVYDCFRSITISLFLADVGNIFHIIHSERHISYWWLMEQIRANWYVSVACVMFIRRESWTACIIQLIWLSKWLTTMAEIMGHEALCVRETKACCHNCHRQWPCCFYHRLGPICKVDHQATDPYYYLVWNTMPSDIIAYVVGRSSPNMTSVVPEAGFKGRHK